MKIRQGFVSNSSSSSFVIALPKSYKFSDEEMAEIRDQLEDYDGYFDYYGEIAESQGNTEVVDERERIQQMLESGKFEEVEEVEPVNDNVKNVDIQKGFEFLTTDGYFWHDEIHGDIPTLYAAKAIFEALMDKIVVTSTETSSDAGQVVNILADSYVNTRGSKLLREYIKNED